MTQNFQAIVEETSKNDTRKDQTFLIGSSLIFFNLFVMSLVGLYWMNPEMHEFISGRPLL